MATIYKCDKCGREFKRPDEVERITVPEYERYGKLNSEKNYDLCNLCVDNLTEYLRPDPVLKTQ